MAFVLQSFAEDTLASDITDSSTSMTLTTGNFGTPSGEQMLVIDPDVSSKREIVKCAIDGTAVTSIDRAQDGTAAVAHTSGAKIIMAWTKSHHEALKDGTDLNDNIITAAKLDANLLAGWLLLAASGTRVSNTSFTVSGDVTDQISVGDKLKITDTTTKYLYVTAVTYGAPNTTITVTGGTDYVVAGNPTNIYYSKAVSPVGFPATTDTFGPTGLNYAQSTSTFSNTPGANTYVNVTGLSLAVTVPDGKSVKLTAFCPSIKSAADAGQTITWAIREGTTVLNKSVMQVNAVNYNVPATCVAYVDAPTAGVHTYVVSLATSQASKAVATENVAAASPAFILAELI